MLRLVAALLALSVPVAASAQTVDSLVAANRGGCTTAGFDGLSNQLVRSHLCAFPGSVAEFAPHAGITLTSSRVHALATSETVTALHAAAARTPLSVNSAFRTLVEQYALYNEGGCGLAATPGNSNHQTGRAVDLQNYSAALSAMTAAGCTHPYPTSDAVHFDCPGPDMRSASVLVFQRLWNLNHPEDLIDEDGAYGPQTGGRMGQSPVAGFPMDLCAEPPPPPPPPPPDDQWGAELLASTFDAPVVVYPGDEVVGTIELLNIGTTTWDGSTFLGTTGPRDRVSAMVGPDWTNDHRAAVVDGTVAPGDSFPFTFTLRAPDAPGDYVESFGVVQEGVAWFSDDGQLGPPDDVLQIQIRVEARSGPIDPVDGGGTVVADAGVDGPERPLGVDGCSCRTTPGRPSPLWPLALLVGIAALRRSRSRHHDL
ncbi:MAG: D-alanyl-D-alanine carboxypeptidase family protein [Sandaracinaceae bacterium]|nr:D-alanyl-D-alanine carboxypeptidase family protein [Sandaracinaceae bacterium]